MYQSGNPYYKLNLHVLLQNMETFHVLWVIWAIHEQICVPVDYN